MDAVPAYLALLLCVSAVSAQMLIVDRVPRVHSFSRITDDNNTLYNLAKQLKATTFIEMVGRAGLSSVYQDPNSKLTLFLPTNEAFSKASSKVLNDTIALKHLLEYHTGHAVVALKDITNEQLLPSNYRHVITKRYDIRLNIYSFGVPKVYTATGSKIISPDHVASGGVIHVVDRVAYPEATENLFTILEKNQDVSSFFQFLTKIGLASLLKNTDPFSVLCPTNEAFVKIPSKDIDLLNTNATLLKQVMQRHLMNGTYFREGLLDGLQLKSFGGEPLTFLIAGAFIDVFADHTDALVVTADIAATNGVMYTLDTVLFDVS